MDYEESGQELVNRIVALIPNNRQILEMAEPWGLFKIKGFKCDDLQPTLAMASVALSIAKEKYRKTVMP